jgi:hypothetical protein
LRQLTRTDLFLALDACAALLGRREFIVVGAVSIVGAVANPPAGLAVSHDIDLFPPPDGDAATTAAVNEHFGEGSAFEVEHDFYIESVGRWTLMTALDGWEARLIRVESPSGVAGLCLSPLDLAYVKPDAGREKDIAYVRAMLGAGIVSRREIEEAIATATPDARERLTAALRLAE